MPRQRRQRPHTGTLIPQRGPGVCGDRGSQAICRPPSSERKIALIKDGCRICRGELLSAPSSYPLSRGGPFRSRCELKSTKVLRPDPVVGDAALAARRRRSDFIRCTSVNSFRTPMSARDPSPALLPDGTRRETPTGVPLAGHPSAADHWALDHTSLRCGTVAGRRTAYPAPSSRLYSACGPTQNHTMLSPCSTARAR